MLSLFRALVERLKALFITDIAQEFEAELLTRAAERKAELLRKATRYEEEGLHGIAEHLRRQAEELDLRRPLAGVLPAVYHLQDNPQEEPVQPRLRLVGGNAPPARVPSPDPKKRGGKP